MGAERVRVINAALARIGAIPIQSDMDPFARPHVEVYDAVTKRIFAYPWSFAKTTRRLVARADAPDPAHWLTWFDLPPDRIGPPRAVYTDPDCRRPLTDFDIADGRLLCNDAQAWLVFMRFVTWERWPGDVYELVQVAMMAEYALSIREDRPLHDRLYQKAFGTPQQNGMGGLLSSALENDSQGTPSTVVGGGENPLIDCRW